MILNGLIQIPTALRTTSTTQATTYTEPRSTITSSASSSASTTQIQNAALSVTLHGIVNVTSKM